MNAYFDTSALVPLLIEEPGSERARGVWDEAVQVVSVRLVYPEARSALAQARRKHRINNDRLRQAVSLLDQLFARLDLIEVTDDLAHRAGELAEVLALRAYDAVHVAAAERVHNDDLVMVAGDAAILRAGTTLGLTTAATN